MRATQLGVQVVVDASHLSDSYPVLAFERQPERPPAQVGWHIQNEARHVGQLDAAYIPEGRKKTFTVFTLPFCVVSGETEDRQREKFT